MRKISVYLISIFVILSSFLEATTDSPKKSVCLNMIVKNESEVIERCLGSVKPFIDYWVIVDTGSTDGTQDVIKNFMKDIPGELHERPWTNFEHNRNEALSLAKGKGEYLLIIDADEILEYEKEYSLPSLDKDFFFMKVRELKAVDIQRIALIKESLNWKWTGVLHEMLVCTEAHTSGILEGIVNICNGAIGGRSKIPKKEKYLKDALVLEEALKTEPNNSRYMMYLAQSYMAAEEYLLAKKCLERRVTMASSDEQETFRAIYTLGDALEKLDDLESARKTFMQAHSFRPTRAEPLHRAAVIHRKKGEFLLGYLLSKYALSLPYPTGEWCVEYQTYEYAMQIEYANCSLLLGKFAEGLQACNELLSNPKMPAEYIEPVKMNLEIARENLK